MATQVTDVPALLEWVQQASIPTLGDNPTAKGELLHRLDVVRREIEGPASYLSRVRQAVSRKEQATYRLSTDLGLEFSLYSICASSWRLRWDS